VAWRRADAIDATLKFRKHQKQTLSQYRIRKAPEQQRSDHGPPELGGEVEEREGPVSYDGYRRLEGAWEYFLSSIGQPVRM
jgi:hypothetical protein